MNLATVRMELYDTPGVLLRALALAERRGFEVRRVEAGARPRQRLEAVMHCRFQGRATEQLVAPLEKLVDVVSVVAVAVAMAPSAAAAAIHVGGPAMQSSRFAHG